ncbi:MAG: hypothetical protein V4724_12390 [Pseudomonadota bacterium]
MDGIVKPSKQQVRDWLRQRRTENQAPPDSEQIRRELGWCLTQAAREADERAALRFGFFLPVPAWT